MRRTVVVACALVLSACGVGSEEEPQIIEESTQEPPDATPSFDTETEPATSSAPTTLSTTAALPGQTR